MFAAQMLNFPVASGTSGHLLGGVLAAVLVGPWAGALAVSVVLVVQALLFADGGLSAWASTSSTWHSSGPSSATAPSSAAAAARQPAGRCRRPRGVAGFLVPSLASLAFVVEYAVGGNGAASVGTVAAAMVGVHALIGIGEGIITALAVGAVMATRPDLVYGARGIPSVARVRSPQGHDAVTRRG